MEVEVEIPLNETELGQPFGQLQTLFAPLDRLLSGMPDSNEQFFERLNQSDAAVPTLQQAPESETLQNSPNDE
jgi:hypothetical protein